MANLRQSAPPGREAPAPWRHRAAGALAAVARRPWEGLRAWAGRRCRMLAWIAAGLFLLASGAVTVWGVQAARSRALAAGLTLDAALEKLDSGEYHDARRLALALPPSGKLPPGETGGPSFVYGAALAYEAEGAWDEPRRPEFFLLAAQHLNEAREKGFPPGRRSEGLLLLGNSLQEAGRYAQSIPVLLELVDASPALAGKAHRLLARAYLHSLPPRPDKARRHCDAFLASSPILPDDRHEGLLLEAQIALAQSDWPACAERLEQIPASSPLQAEALMLQGRMRLAEAAAEPNEETSPDEERPQPTLYRQAIESFRQASARAPHDLRIVPQAAYFIGVALRRSGQLDAAQRQFASLARLHHDAPESLLATLEEAEVLSALERWDEAGAAYVRTIGLAGAPDEFTNRWITVEQLRERIEAGYAAMADAHRHDLAAKLSRAMPPLFEIGRALELRAKAHHGWAGDLMRRADQLPAEERPQLLSRARRHYRQAGVEYARLAHLHYSLRRYPEDLWQAGKSFSLGRDYESAIVLFREYLQTEARTQRPLVMAAMGEALLSLDKTDEAIGVLEDCLRDFAKDPASYEGRLLASKAYVEKGDRPRAIALLLDNLHHESLTPRSGVWRDSLFALGKVLHDEGLSTMARQRLEPQAGASPGRGVAFLEAGHAQLQEAVRRLSEAVARYPDDPQATMALYLIAESERQAARLPLTKLETETIESRRLALNRQARGHLSSALESYDRLVARFNERGEGQTLSPTEESILRNAYFARGMTLYELGSYEDAIAAYSTATSRYQHEPAALEAYVQIAACFRRLNKPLEARGTLEQAKLVMERIRPEADFTATTRFDRQEWKTLLDWMSTL